MSVLSEGKIPDTSSPGNTIVSSQILLAMKKIIWLLAVVCFALTLHSCTPQSVEDVVSQACCGDDGDIPPYTPPGGGGG